MSFEIALRASEILLAFALGQRAAEHISLRDYWPFGLQLACAVLLLIGVMPGWMCLALLMIGVWTLRHFDGPYNGGADKMAFLATACLTAAHWLPTQDLREGALGYLAIQVTLSYVVSGFVKLVNTDWLRGKMLGQVFAISAYPTSQSVQSLASRKGLLMIGSLTVISFELAFPLALLSQDLLMVALGCALAFHIANAVLLGLNRFVWSWVSAYPALIWFQSHVLAL